MSLWTRTWTEFHTALAIKILKIRKAFVILLYFWAFGLGLRLGVQKFESFGLTSWIWSFTPTTYESLDFVCLLNSDLI